MHFINFPFFRNFRHKKNKKIYIKYSRLSSAPSLNFTKGVKKRNSKNILDIAFLNLFYFNQLKIAIMLFLDIWVIWG